MSTSTESLNLFKYDPQDDAKKTFDIKKSLNDNWDKIDKMAKKQVLEGVYYNFLETVNVDLPTIDKIQGTIYEILE